MPTTAAAHAANLVTELTGTCGCPWVLDNRACSVTTTVIIIKTTTTTITTTIIQVITLHGISLHTSQGKYQHNELCVCVCAEAEAVPEAHTAALLPLL